MVDYDIRPYAAGDEQGILATFNCVFGEDDPSFEPRTLADWEWTYRRNPSGTRVWVAVRDGLVAAHYASQPNRVRVEGKERIFGQILDSMVHPEHRQGLKRPGLFVETARCMLDATCGPDKDLVTYAADTTKIQGDSEWQKLVGGLEGMRTIVSMGLARNVGP